MNTNTRKTIQRLQLVLTATLAAILAGCATTPPLDAVARKFTSSPLRNRVRVELKAPVKEVWALIGNLSRFPEYSSGLEKVEAMVSAHGTPANYVCHFKPLEAGGERIVSREIIRWYEPNRGYASSGEQSDAFGLKNDLHLVTVEASKAGTLLTWDEYYDAQDLKMMEAHFDQALADIGKNLARRFGGRLVERYVESQP